MFWLLVHFVLYGQSGFRDETLAAYAQRGATYQLVELEGENVETSITLSFPRIWHLHAHTPCFQYSAKIATPYPWFRLNTLNKIEYACIETTIEHRFVYALKKARLAEVHAGTLILTLESESEMVFRVKP